MSLLNTQMDNHLVIVGTLSDLRSMCLNKQNLVKFRFMVKQWFPISHWSWTVISLFSTLIDGCLETAGITYDSYIWLIKAL